MAAGAYLRVGEITSEIGSKEAAIKAHDNALAIRKALVAGHPANSVYQCDLAELQVDGKNAGCDRQTESGSQLDRRAIAIWRKLTRESAEIENYWAGLAGTLHNLGIIYDKSGNPDGAVKAYEEAIRILREQLSHSDHDEFQHTLANILNSLGLVEKHRGNLDVAQDSFRQAIDILSSLQE